MSILPPIVFASN